MANEQNLIPLGSGKRSEKEEREMRSRGGKKSGETRRKKTAMKKVANLLLNMPVSEEAYPTIINTLQKMGFEDDMITNQTAMLVSMWREAMDGNVRAAEFMRDTAGQKQENIQAQKEFEQRRSDSKEIRRIRHRVEFLESEIGKVEARMKDIEKILSNPGPGDDIMELTRTYLEDKRELDHKTAEWESLMEKIDE